MDKIKTLVDIVWKITLIAGLAAFLRIYEQKKDIGRYAYISTGELEYVVDTTTGVIYQGGFSMNHLTGEERTAGKPGK
ncbi:hypothetical protein [Desulfolutivibrio sulfoxidireducens]|uniref:hypothetical protein n=1 Tax=Desulfolutivibrio sulfoxidireducens TaxID=2773299 RepID=UPI00159E15F4|nr:hypothetical protein [Desulfolutivibrio sulfoxidireducens]QLA15017.1 hypothetical protein GD605_02080 [Desulfolutivibrio sulfoxidireducens]QLA18584.1 hypothetical protein GD604_01990 [Desulfolutivibrio sulfoxidireducens]